MALQLRYYQGDAARDIQFAWSEYRNILCHLGTSGGKTVIAAYIIGEMLPARTLFLVDQDELCQQAREVIQRHIGITPALEKAESYASPNSKVVVASAQTLSKPNRLQRFPSDFFQYIIVDEAHRGSDRDAKIIDYFGLKCRSMGITATPFRANLKDLSKYYQYVAFSMPMIDLIAEGFSPPLHVITKAVEIDLEMVRQSFTTEGNDYEPGSLDTTIAPHFEAIANALKEHDDRFTIVRLPLIKSSQAFAEIARRAGIRARHIDGTSEDREAIIRAFKQGEFNMLCNANLIEVGVDIPNADCMVNLSPTRSRARYQQLAGRIMRVLPGTVDDLPGRDQAEERKVRIAKSAKPNSLIIDFLWKHDDLFSAGPSSLIATNAEQERLIYEKLKKQRTPEELMEIAKAVQEAREEALTRELDKAAVKIRRDIVDPQLFGHLIRSKHLIGYESETVRRPTPKQLDLIQRNGIVVEHVLDFTHASLLIDEIMHRNRYQLATITQLGILKTHEARLKDFKYDPRTLDKRTAYDLIHENNKRLYGSK